MWELREKKVKNSVRSGFFRAPDRIIGLSVSARRDFPLRRRRIPSVRGGMTCSFGLKGVFSARGIHGRAVRKPKHGEIPARRLFWRGMTSRRGGTTARGLCSCSLTHARNNVLRTDAVVLAFGGDSGAHGKGDDREKKHSGALRGRFFASLRMTKWGGSAADRDDKNARRKDRTDK